MLDKFKSIDNPAYPGMPSDKITPTVGLNGTFKPVIMLPG
jgi:hypothetical protein